MAEATARTVQWRAIYRTSLVGVLALGACVSTPEPREPVAVSPPAVSAPPQAALSPPPHPIKKPPTPAPQPAPPAAVDRAAPVALPPPTEPAPAESRPKVDPDHVIGLAELDASDWLGPPDQRSEAAPATIWRYTRQDCEVDVYFYLDLQNRVMRALHYEVRSSDNAERSAEKCFQQLVDEHRRRAGNAAAAYRSD